MQDLERNFTPQEDAGQELQLLIKNPAKDASSDFGLSVAFESTLGHVKQQIQKDYAGSPPPEAQTVSLTQRPRTSCRVQVIQRCLD